MNFYFIFQNVFRVSKHNLTELNYLLTLGLKTVTSAIDGRFNVGESLEPDECECALEALGNIGSCKSVIYQFSNQSNSILWNQIPNYSYKYIQSTTY